MATVNFDKERKLKAAMDWLREQLSDGQEHLAGGLIIRGVEAGHSERTLQRASTLLHVEKNSRLWSCRPAGDGRLAVEIGANDPGASKAL